MTFGELYLTARKELSRTESIQQAGIIARDLICTFAAKSSAEFLAVQNESCDQKLCDNVFDGIRRIQEDEPLAYVLGEWEFYGLPLYVTKDVLIPRDDTCAVAELAIKTGLFLDKDPRVLDLCCGSGCIGIAVASRLKDARVTLADISRDALAVAKKNIARNKFGGRMSCFQVDAMADPPGFLGKFDLIVSNPPYITSSEMLELPGSVKNYEPHIALHGGEDGLCFYRAIAQKYSSVLKPGGYLCFEFGYNQGNDVCRILAENGYVVLERVKDFNDRERAVLAQKPV